MRRALNDPEVVAREYASERGLAARKAAYEWARGPDARDVAFAAVAEVAPVRVLEVGCGEGEFAERVQRELGCEVVAIDQSERMVEITRGRGVDARLGDVQALPFADGEFDCAVANWMLYHVPELDRALAELARVLRPRGRLVAATNSVRHLAELWTLVGRDPFGTARGFSAESGSEELARHFAQVERRDVEGALVFPDQAAVVAYVESSIVCKHLAAAVPPFDGGLTATRRNAVFVAEKE
jgi:SAM-dependent methyltransferase